MRDKISIAFWIILAIVLNLADIAFSTWIICWAFNYPFSLKACIGVFAIYCCVVSAVHIKIKTRE